MDKQFGEASALKSDQLEIDLSVPITNINTC